MKEFDILETTQFLKGVKIFVNFEVTDNVKRLVIKDYKETDIIGKDVKLQFCNGNGDKTDNSFVTCGFSMVYVWGNAPPPVKPPPPAPHVCHSCTSTQCGCYDYEKPDKPFCHFIWGQHLTREEGEKPKFKYENFLCRNLSFLMFLEARFCK